MLFGFALTPKPIALGGAVVLTLVAFQILVGLRKIEFGRNHLKVHKAIAWTLLAVAVVHGSAALIWLFGLRIG